VGHFFKTYSFDLDKTLLFFTAGRFEFRNKGYDLTLKALAKLNERLKQEKSQVTIIMFFITPRPYFCLKPDVLQSKVQMEEIHRNCNELQQKLGDKLFLGLTRLRKRGRFPDLNQLLDEYTMMRIRLNLQAWHTDLPPSVVTHNLKDEAGDPVMNFLWSHNLMNSEEDRVKIVYHPEFINSHNPLFHMDYYQFIRGCHLGVFPSYYEPWGYTPLECVASGIPSITSDMAGFGSFVHKHMKDHEKSGIYVLKRKNINDEAASESLMQLMHEFTGLSLRERVAQRNRVAESSSKFGWDKLASYYNKAHLQAVKMSWSE
jgi:glycogen(starch) synthase